jgi:hypothetical protein
MWIAVSGLHVLYLYFVSKVATAASLIAIFSSANARAFRESESPRAVLSCRATGFQTPIGDVTA